MIRYSTSCTVLQSNLQLNFQFAWQQILVQIIILCLSALVNLSSAASAVAGNCLLSWAEELLVFYFSNLTCSIHSIFQSSRTGAKWCLSLLRCVLKQLPTHSVLLEGNAVLCCTVIFCEASAHPAGTAAVQEEEELRPMSSQSTGRKGREMWLRNEWKKKQTTTFFLLFPLLPHPVNFHPVFLPDQLWRMSLQPLTKTQSLRCD